MSGQRRFSCPCHDGWDQWRGSPTVVATGPVTFTVGKTVLGTAQLSGGIAHFTSSTLPVGRTTITVTYDGASNIAKSFASLTQTVN